MDKTEIALYIISILTAIALIGSFLKMKAGFGPFNLKIYGLTLVIGFSAILVLTELPSDKLTPCIGILSAVAGYLFGLKKDE